MDAKQFRTYQMLQNVAAFEAKYRRDFAPGSNAAKRFDDNTHLLIKIEELVATHNAALGEFPDEVLGREIDVSTLRAQLRTIVETGQRVFGSDPERAKKLRIPRKDTVSQLLLDTRALRHIAFANQSAFLARKMPADFLSQLDVEIAAVWQQLRAAQGEMTAQSATTPDLNPILKKAVANVRLLDAPIQTKYATNPAVLGEWETASRIDYGQNQPEN